MIGYLNTLVGAAIPARCGLHRKTRRAIVFSKLWQHRWRKAPLIHCLWNRLRKPLVLDLRLFTATFPIAKHSWMVWSNISILSWALWGERSLLTRLKQ